jgi:hypothetical protein
VVKRGERVKIVLVKREERVNCRGEKEVEG